MGPIPFIERIRIVREANRLANQMVSPASAYRGARPMPISGLGQNAGTIAREAARFAEGFVARREEAKIKEAQTRTVFYCLAAAGIGFWFGKRSKR